MLELKVQYQMESKHLMHVLTLVSIGVKKNQYGSLIAKTQREVYPSKVENVAVCEKIDFLIAPEKPEFSAVIARHFWTSIGCLELKCSFGLFSCFWSILTIFCSFYSFL